MAACCDAADCICANWAAAEEELAFDSCAAAVADEEDVLLLLSLGLYAAVAAEEACCVGGRRYTRGSLMVLAINCGLSDPFFAVDTIRLQNARVSSNVTLYPQIAFVKSVIKEFHSKKNNK